MSEGINTDKVIVNAGGAGGYEGGGGLGGAGLAAVIAALGNRNEGSDNAALVAALAGRDNYHHDGIWPALLAANGGGWGGNGLAGILPILLLFGLLGGRGRGFGFGGGGDDCCNDGHGGVFALLSKLGSIEGSIPLSAANTANEICRSTGQIQAELNQNNLAQLAATSGVKDSVQNGVAAILTDNCRNTQSVLGAISNLSSKIDQNTIIDLQRQLGVCQADIAEERHGRRIREVEVNVNNQATAVQAQLQSQWQQQRFEDERFRTLFGAINVLGNTVQRSRNEQDIVNLGTMLASGTQTPTTTQVR